MKILFYDDETTGLPIWSTPSSDPAQPHIVSAAAKLVDSESRKVLQQFALVVYNDDWAIPQEVIDIHGIDETIARSIGVSEIDVVNMLFSLSAVADVRIAHNQPFDERIMRIALKRYLDDEAAELWRSHKTACTMKMCKGIVKAKGRHGPSLSAAYAHFFGEKLRDHHSAMADTDACMRVYFEIMDAA